LSYFNIPLKVLIFLLIIFICVNSIKNKQLVSKARQNSKHKLPNLEDRRNSPAKNYVTRSSSISLASDLDDEPDENPYSISPRELVKIRNHI
jgi:hypothetical protein